MLLHLNAPTKFTKRRNAAKSASSSFDGFPLMIMKKAPSPSHPQIEIQSTFQKSKFSKAEICEKNLENLNTIVCFPFSSWSNFQWRPARYLDQTGLPHRDILGDPEIHEHEEEEEEPVIVSHVYFLAEDQGRGEVPG